MTLALHLRLPDSPFQPGLVLETSPPPQVAAEDELEGDLFEDADGGAEVAGAIEAVDGEVLAEVGLLVEVPAAVNATVAGEEDLDADA